MPYGVKRGVKAPGQYNISDLFGLGLASSAGIIAALVTDYNQRGEASSLYTINQWVVDAGQILGLGDIPLWVVVLGLIAAGAGSIFYFQPITRQGAFAQGFSLLAVIMTAVPADLAGSLETLANGGGLLELAPAEPGPEAGVARDGVVSATYSAAAAAPLVRVQHSSSAAVYPLRLTVTFTDGMPDDIDSMIRRGALRGRVHNAQTGETYNLFRAAGGALTRAGDSIVVEAGVPARADSAEIWIRIECNGYVIEEQSRTATLGQSLDWEIFMQPTSTPIFIQRLQKSYWF